MGYDTREMSTLFDVDLGGHRDYGDIMAEANAKLAMASMRAQRRAEELAYSKRTLQIKAITDPLTGVASRTPHLHFHSPEPLIRVADAALYESRRAGRGSVRIYTPQTAAAAH